MAEITDISKQQKRDRVSMSVDGKYSFSLTVNQFVESGLKIRQQITDSEIDNFKNDSEYGKLLDRALQWCLMRPRSQKELCDYLYRKTEDTDIKNRISSYLLDKNYINDEEFTKFWIKSRMNSKKPSIRMLTAELRSKGIDSTTISQCISEIDYSEIEMIKALIEKKQKQTRYQDKDKLIAYLARQGFSYSLIKEHTN